MIFGAKNYYWCYCGMSRKQPFCDSSHAGTSFKPLKFSLDEKTKNMHLCGCKLTTQAPFCDGETCKKLMDGQNILESRDDEGSDYFEAEIEDGEESADK